MTRGCEAGIQPVMELRTLSETFAIARLAAGAAVPDWVGGRELIAVVRTPNELSILCQDAAVPANLTEVQRGFKAFAVAGTLDFTLIGIIASLAQPLAATGIPIFGMSTYDTDYILVQADMFEAAKSALTAAGHSVT